MWTLYGSLGSGSAAVEMALLRCGLPFRVIRASTWEPDSARTELLAVNPMGQIPTLVSPDGAVLTESVAILLHLGLTVPASGLLPADAARRAQVMRGLVFVAANCYVAIGIIDYPERWCPEAGAPTLQKLRRGARQRLHTCWDLFADQFLSVMAFAPDAEVRSTSRASALDLLAAVVSRWSGARAHLAVSRPALLAALQAVELQPDWQPVFNRHWPPAAA